MEVCTTMKLSKLILVVAFLVICIPHAHAEAPKHTIESYDIYLKVTPEIQSTMRMTDYVFERIAVCESNNNPKEKNPTSTAKGRFQFLDGTWKYYGLKYWGNDFYTKDVLSYADNTELAWYVYKKYGSDDWNASKNCWDR
jgi:hypothetical protein